MGVRASSGTGRRDVVLGAGSAFVALGLLLVLPLLASSDPDAAAEMPDQGVWVWLLAVGAVLAQSVALVWAARAPRWVLLGVVAVALAVSPAGLGLAFGVTAVCVMVAVYVAVVHDGVSSLRWVLAAAVGALAVANVVNARGQGITGPIVLEAVAQSALTVGAPLVVAVVVASRRATLAAQRAEILALAREREALVEAALARERTAMARELHDIAAHHLSGIALMAGALDRQIDADPAGAKESVRQVRTQATEVLTDLRRLVGLLRADDVAVTGVERLAGIATLVRDHPGQVELTSRPRADGADLGEGIGPLAQLAAYRMVQEALANAVRHAPGAACHVTIDDSAAHLALVMVRNSPPRTPTPARGDGGGGEGHAGDGFGLLGMRERAELTGADLHYGPTPDGGWEVSLRLRRDEPTGGQYAGEVLP